VPAVFFFRKRSMRIEGIEVRGGAEFLQRTGEALTLLAATRRFAEVRSHLALIRQGRRSGMHAGAKRPVFVVGKPTWKHSTLWYAGAIVHDAYHSKLYHSAKQATGGAEPDADLWTGTEAETKCLAFQRQVLEELNADEKIIAYIQACERNPTYQGRNKGWRGWLDYLNRRW
jgi:hypothetical protein